MQREHDQDFDLIDLGAASAETQGAMEGTYDFIGHIQREGLSDD